MNIDLKSSYLATSVPTAAALSAKRLEQQMSLPLIVGPMFLISNPEMTIACCKAGFVGSFPALNQRTSEGFNEWLALVRESLEELKANNPGGIVSPFAVNLSVHSSNHRLAADLDLCVQHRAPIVITTMGIPKYVVEAVHSYGGLVLHDIVSIRHAEKAVEAGVDGLIVISSGAGGHAGSRNPIAFVNELRDFFDGIIVLAGTLSTGKDILTTQVIGADFAYMGTRFIATQESSAPPAYKQMICEASGDDVIYTATISGVPANFLRGSIPPDSLAVQAEHAIKDPDSRGFKHGNEAKDWKDIWSAGQGVGNIHDIPKVVELAERLHVEYAQAKRRLLEQLDTCPR